MIVIETWDEEERGTLSLESIRASLDDLAAYRLSEDRYPPGTSFTGTMRHGRMHVLAGACRIRHRESETVLSPGDVAAIPTGDYEFAVEGDEDFCGVIVWKLPPRLRWG